MPGTRLRKPDTIRRARVDATLLPRGGGARLPGGPPPRRAPGRRAAPTRWPPWPRRPRARFGCRMMGRGVWGSGRTCRNVVASASRVTAEDAHGRCRPRAECAGKMRRELEVTCHAVQYPRTPLSPCCHRGYLAPHSPLELTRAGAADRVPSTRDKSGTVAPRGQKRRAVAVIVAREPKGHERA